MLIKRGTEDEELSSVRGEMSRSKSITATSLVTCGRVWEIFTFLMGKWRSVV